MAAWFIGFLVLQTRLESDSYLLTRIAAVKGDPGRGRIHRWRRRFSQVGGAGPVAASEWSGLQAAIYSLDRLLPAAKLTDLGTYPALTRAQTVWLQIQQIFGWLLTLFIVGWLTGLLAQT